MVNLKNLARRKARQSMHNSEDARVIETAPSQEPKAGRIAWVKAKAVTLLKWIARIRLCIYASGYGKRLLRAGILSRQW